MFAGFSAFMLSKMGYRLYHNISDRGSSFLRCVKKAANAGMYIRTDCVIMFEMSAGM